MNPIQVFDKKRIYSMIRSPVQFQKDLSLKAFLEHYGDEERERTKAYRTSPVATAEVSATAKAKADTKRTGEGLTVFSMDSLMAHLGTLTLNEVGLPSQPEKLYMVTSIMTPAQLKAFELLNIPDKEKVFTVN